METAATIAATRAFVKARRGTGHRVGFVPTMGYLHAGHLELVRRARAGCGTVVASIFVNPLQFGPKEDFRRYPRDLARDSALLAQAGCDLLFAPDVAEMYPQPTLVCVEPKELTEHLCGASRPGHFTGVATVVAKLLHIVQPDVAYFGEKDAQQLAVIRRMVADLNLDVEIAGVPTVREPDGLAMSSRNVYLSPEERRAATVLHRALRHGADRVAAGERDAAALVDAVRAVIAAEPLARIDYVSAVDAATLRPLSTLSGRVLLATAVFFGTTRLIDNISLEVAPVAAHAVSE